MDATPASPAPAPRTSIFRKWLSLSGLIIIVGSVFSFTLLFLLDAFAHYSNPYVGILTYLVAPGFFCDWIGVRGFWRPSLASPDCKVHWSLSAAQD